MAWLPISGTVPQYSTINNALASDYYLKFYAAGTATPINMATDSTGGTLLAKCALSTFGCPITNPLDISTRFIPHIDQNYRIVLFKNEADADSNNTAEAAFNIDAMALQIAPSADATDISLRDTNVEVQDDYDRSPIFVATDGFTAGAGPHVITVPTVWTPTNTDMRFYKVDASGIVTTLTPTSTSSTTFTLTETLLSTDLIFIGDDTFRSLNIATQAEANDSKGSELITVKTLSGRLSTETMAGIVEKATSAEFLAGTANKFPDCATIKVDKVPITVWTGSSSSVTTADILSSSGFVVKIGIYTLHQGVSSKFAIVVTELDGEMYSGAELTSGSYLTATAARRQTTGQFSVRTIRSDTGALSNPTIDTITYVSL
jgi:hypothetical protein